MEVQLRERLPEATERFAGTRCRYYASATYQRARRANSREVTSENYFHDLPDESLYADGAMLEKPGIPTQPKLYLVEQR